MHSKILLAVTFLNLLVMAFSGGIIVSFLRTNAVSTPIIQEQSVKRKISGTLAGVDRSKNGSWRAKVRLTEVQGLPLNSIPKYVRVTTYSAAKARIGSSFECVAVLRPPPKAIVPGGYSFARKAWFLQIGAVGYCEGPPILSPPIASGIIDSIQNSMTDARLAASKSISNGKTGGGAGFLAAITTGDRSWISEADARALQGSGLGHIISVSGIHVSLIAGLVYFALVRMLSLLGAIPLWFDVRKIAAMIGLGCAVGYTIFTGSEAPAIRAAIMTSIAFVAILIDRQAISLRGLAIAAFLILLFRPEHAADAGFQMSFLATMALVALWEIFIPKSGGAPRALINRIGFWLLGAVLASLVAGLATLPISINNFGRFSTYGLVANVIAAPIVDFAIGPFAVLGATLSPFGLDEWAWKVAIWGLNIVLRLAYYFSAIDVQTVALSPLSVFPCFLMVFAVVWACFWRGGLKIFALLPLFASIFLWATAPIPELYVAAGARAIYSPRSQAKNQHINVSRLCFLKNARFDALRLIDQSNATQTQKAIDVAALGQSRTQKCAIGRGDWEAHFVNEQDFFGANTRERLPKGVNRLLSNKQGKQKNLNPREDSIETELTLERNLQESEALSITFGNETRALDAQNTPNGAILYRKGWRLSLYQPQSTNRPWNQD